MHRFIVLYYCPVNVNDPTAIKWVQNLATYFVIQDTLGRCLDSTNCYSYNLFKFNFPLFLLFVCLFVFGNIEHLQTASLSVNICLLVFLQSEEIDDLNHEQISQTLASEISPLEEMATSYKSDAQNCPNEFQQSQLDLMAAISVNIRQ